MNNKLERIVDDNLASVSGGSEISQGKEEIRYGGEDCPECGSSDTEAHYKSGRVIYIKCFECGFEKHFIS